MTLIFLHFPLRCLMIHFAYIVLKGALLMSNIFLVHLLFCLCNTIQWILKIDCSHWQSHSLTFKISRGQPAVQEAVQVSPQEWDQIWYIKAIRQNKARVFNVLNTRDASYAWPQYLSNIYIAITGCDSGCNNYFLKIHLRCNIPRKWMHTK